MKTLRRLAGFMRPYWYIVLGAMALVMIVSGLGLAQPLIIRWIIDRVLQERNFHLLPYGALAIVGASLVRGILTFAQRYSLEYMAQRIIYDVRNRLYAHLQQLSFSFYDKAQTGQLMSRLTADVETLHRFLSFGVIQITSNLFMLVMAIVIMVRLDWQLTIVAILVLPFLVHAVYRFARVVRPMYWQIQDQLAVLTATLQENVTGQRVVKAFARERYEMDKFDIDNTNLFTKHINTVRTSAFYNTYMQFLSELSAVGILWYGGRRIIAGALTVGSLVAFNQYLFNLIAPIRMLGFLVNLAQRAVAAGDRIFEILDTRAEVADRPGARPIPPIRGRVVFKDVRFSYDGRTHVLEDINLTVEPGQTIAVLGSTGSGKSTLINLLPRFYDVSAGAITIDGHDIRDVTLESLRRQLGIVTQETFLFSASLKENISYGRPGASMAEIIAAAKAAHIHDFIVGLPQGYESVIGERGVGLSGGQKQRVAIARAILTDARILILDESTSSVDVETEFRIQQAFNQLLKNRTAFVIAQRLSTVRNADEIIVLDKGRIVERGTHRELLAANGMYTAIYDLQFRGQEDAQVAASQGGAGQ
ncbi:MAG: ABC transporter ATP-binding protein [Bacillota bacterium]